MGDPVFKTSKFTGLHVHAETDMLSITFITGFATVFGTAEGIRAAQAKSRREEHRSRKNNLVVHVPKSSQFSPVLEGRSVVLSGDRLFIDTGTAHDQPFGHPFEGYYLPYPDTRYSGLVSSITHEAPIMNWIYVDRETYQVKFGNRLASEGHFTGPWDCTRQDRRLVFGGWEGFCAVYSGGLWGLCFDVDGDRLKSKLGGDYVVLDIDLVRRELRTARPQSSPPEEPPEATAKANDEKPVQPSCAENLSARGAKGETCQPREDDAARLTVRDEDDRSDSGLSGVTCADDGSKGDTDRTGCANGTRVLPDSPCDIVDRSSRVYSQDDQASSRNSVLSSSPMDSAFAYRLSAEAFEALQEDVD